MEVNRNYFLGSAFFSSSWEVKTILERSRVSSSDIKWVISPISSSEDYSSCAFSFESFLEAS